MGNSNPALFAALPTISAAGELTYTPLENAYGSATIAVALSDDGGSVDDGINTSAVQVFTIAVTPVNDAPSFTSGNDQTVLENAGPQTVDGWASAITAGPEETDQNVDFDITNSNPALFAEARAISSTSQLTYTPAADKLGSATLSVFLEDDGGVANGGVDTSAVQTFTIEVTPVNDAPSFTEGSDQSVLEDSGPQTVDGWASTITAGPDEADQSVAGNQFG